MATKQLTKREVDRAKPDKHQKTGAPNVAFLWDTELKGFGLRVSPNGRKAYVIQYRPQGLGRAGKTTRLTIGAHGPLTPDAARRRARQLLARVANGEDPGELASARKRAPTVADVAMYYLADIDAKKKPRTAAEYRRLMEKHVLPAIGTRRVREVPREKLAALHDAGRKTPFGANRVLAVASAFLSWCERRNYRDPGTNPCRGLERYREQGRERFLSTAELARLGDALRTMKRSGANPVAINAIRFLMFSGFREQEALTLRWDAVDFSRELATLGDSKTGRSQRLLGGPALALLAELPQEVGNPYVFPGKRPRSHLVEMKHVWYAVREAAGLENVRLHDLRHSFASVAASGGASLPLIGALLGHRHVATTQRYAHLTDDARAMVAHRTTEAIAAAMSGETTPVTPLRSRRASRP